MALTTKEGILKVLNAYNPWWKTGATNAALTKTYKRFAFYEAMERMENTQIRRTVVLSGTRRVGKTTIMYQMINGRGYRKEFEELIGWKMDKEYWWELLDRFKHN